MASAYAGNFTLTAGQCILLNNDTICAPSSLLNETALYRQCITDSTSNLTAGYSLVSTQCSSVATSANQSINAASSSISSKIDSMQSSFANFSEQVSKVSGIKLTDQYVACVIDVNLTKDALEQMTRSFQHLTHESELYRLNSTPLQEHNQCVASLAASQSETRSKENERNNFAIAGFIGGIVLWWYVSRRKSQEGLDTYGGARVRPGQGDISTIEGIRDRIGLKRKRKQGM